MIFATLISSTGGSSGSGAVYLEWSGFLSVWIPPLLSVGTAYSLYRYHNMCHVTHCFRHGKHPYREYKLCRKHHPTTLNKITHLSVAKLYKEKH